MAKNIDFMGAIFPDVPSVKLPQQGGGLVSFDDTTDATATADKILQGYTAYANGEKLVGTATGGITPTGTISITQNGIVDVTQYASADVNVSGGGTDRFVLLAEQSLGNISTSNTTAENTNQIVTVPKANLYDLLVVGIFAATRVRSSHIATYRLIFVYGSSNVDTRTQAEIATATLNIMNGNTGLYDYERVATTAYGVYPNSCNISEGNATMSIYKRYSGTYSKTINNDYTARVYGVKLYDLIP